MYVQSRNKRVFGEIARWGIAIFKKVCYNNGTIKIERKGKQIMKHIKTVNKANLKETAAKGGCGKCQTSCQSACKTSCTIANQECESQK